MNAEEARALSSVTFLTPAGCLRVMLRRGLISPSAVVRGEITIEDTSSRNANRKISRPVGRNYLLKQTAGNGQDATVEREALVYSHLSRIRGFYPHLPRFYGYDSGERVLIIEHVRGMHDLAQHYASGGGMTVVVARRIGRILGKLHTLDVDNLPEKLALQTEAPWILAVHRPSLRSLRDISAANLELIRQIQAVPDLCGALDALRGEWVCHALIHMDLRWSNWLVPRRENRADRSGIKLVDWETACLGDARWDIGCTLADNLMWWAMQVPETGGEETARSDRPTAAVERIQRAIQEFWCEYCRTTQIGDAESGRLLKVSSQYAAARLIQSAYERNQAAATLDKFSVSLLQLSVNILRRPDAAISRLFGLGPMRTGVEP